MRRTIISLFLVLSVVMPAAAFNRTQKTMTTKTASVLLPSSAPLISFRILFMTGAASDPKGKEGVAALTAAMLSQGGSRTMTYEQIVEAMYPIAAHSVRRSIKR